MNVAALTRIVIVLGTSLSESDVEMNIAKSSRYLVTKLRVGDVASDPIMENADLVVIEFDGMGDEELQIFSEVRARVPDTPIILVSAELAPNEMRQLFKFNVQDWLSKPLDSDSLLSAINSTVRAKRSSTNQVNAVISCVGGAGATTVAINMADIATKILGPKNANVALVDLDFSTGDCSYVLNMVSSFNLGSVSSTPRRIDREFIGVIQQKHDAGFNLYSFKRPDVNTELSGFELVLRLLDAVSLEHEVLFLDIPYYATEWRNDVLAAVNSYTLVSDVNLPAIKHTIDVIEQIKALRGEDALIQVVFNKHVRQLFGARISKRRIEDLLGDTPFTFLPDDASLIGEAADRGVLPSEISRRSPFLKTLTKFMKSNDFIGAGVK